MRLLAIAALALLSSGALAAPSQPVPENNGGQLKGSTSVTIQDGGTVTRFLSRWLQPVKLWDAEIKGYRLGVLEEVSEQKHRFLGEPAEGTLTLALYPLEVEGAGPARWTAVFAAQEGGLLDLGLDEPLYEVVFQRSTAGRESRGIVSLQNGALILPLTQPPAILKRDRQVLLAGLHRSDTVQDQALGLEPGDWLLTLATPAETLVRLRLSVTADTTVPLRDPPTLGFGKAAGAPSPLLLEAAGAPVRLMVQFGSGVGLVIPLGEDGSLQLGRVVARNVALEVMP